MLRYLNRSVLPTSLQARFTFIKCYSTPPPAAARRPKSLFTSLKPFLKFARPEYNIIGASIGLLLISSTVTMLVPFSMGAIIDLVMQKPDEDEDKKEKKLVVAADGKTKEEMSALFKSSGPLKDLFAKAGSLPVLFSVLGVVFVVGAIANGGRQILMTCASERVITRMRTVLFQSFLHQDIAFHDINRSGELISRLSNDTIVVGRTLTGNIADGLRSLVMSTAGIGAMLYVNVDLTMTMMLIVPGIAAAAVVYGRFVRKLAQETTDASAFLTRFAEEKLSNIRTVRAFSQEGHEVKSYAERANVVYDLGMKEGYASALFFSSMGFAGNIVILAILYYGGILVNSGAISIGELTSFFLYTTYVGSSLVGLSGWYSYLNKGAGSGERIFELLETSSLIENKTGGLKLEHIKGDIKFEEVDFAYPTRSDAQILKGLTFTLKAGQNVAIVGGSGTGKSTIAQLLLRYYDPTHGQITLDGVPIKHLDPSWMRNSVMGYVSQEPTLFASSVMENIRYGKLDATDAEVFEASRKANAHDFILDFPLGYQTQVGDRGHAISGGQKQRIAIARALLKNPRVLLLDEATSALDNASEALVQEALNRLIEGRTSVTIAHRLSTIQRADVICVLKNGAVVESGSYEELMGKKGYFAQIVGVNEDDE